MDFESLVSHAYASHSHILGGGGSRHSTNQAYGKGGKATTICQKNGHTTQADIYVVRWCHVPFGVMNPFWRAMLDLFRDVAAKVRKPTFPMSMGHCFSEGGNDWYAPLHCFHLRGTTPFKVYLYIFLPRSLRQLKRNFEPYVKDPTDVMPGITSTHLLFHKAQSFTLWHVKNLYFPSINYMYYGEE